MLSELPDHVKQIATKPYKNNLTGYLLTAHEAKRIAVWRKKC